MLSTTQKSSLRLHTTTTTTITHRNAPFSTTPVPETIARHHAHTVGPNQCCSAVIQPIVAPVSAVWSVVRRFDNPQAYKSFVKSCNVLVGDGDVGTLREVHVVSGLPAATSRERLEILDEEKHVMSFSVVGGDHRLSNYRSVTTLHSAPGGSGTVVVESYVVDIPHGNTREDTCVCLLIRLLGAIYNLLRRSLKTSVDEADLRLHNFLFSDGYLDHSYW